MPRSAPRQAFEHYLRTGRQLSLAVFSDPTLLETKFNPYHDPQNGQFTSAAAGASGRRDARGAWGGGGFTGGGGGSAGGGGASGSWGKSSPAQSRAAQRDRPNLQSGSVAVRMGSTAPATAISQDNVIVRNGYSYRLDAAGRTTSVTGTLKLSSAPQRSRRAQASAGGSDMSATDDGGHYVAVRFNGPTDTFNHFAQDANINRGGYRVLEDAWAKDVKQGKQVYVAIVPTYDGSSKRPSSIKVTYLINGERGSRSFPNSAKGKSHGK